MYKKIILSAALILVFGFSNSYAQEDCSDPATQADMNICSSLDYKKSDEDLNSIYKKAIERIKDVEPERLEDFKKIQRSWLQYRDLNCGYVHEGSSGGTIAPLLHSTCMTDLTKERISAINNLFMEPLE